MSGIRATGWKRWKTLSTMTTIMAHHRDITAQALVTARLRVMVHLLALALTAHHRVTWLHVLMVLHQDTRQTMARAHTAHHRVMALVGRCLHNGHRSNKRCLCESKKALI